MKIKKRGKITAFVLLVIVFLGMMCFTYVNDYYRSEVGIEDYEAATDYTVEKLEEGILIDGEGTKDAVIFYPGGKVEYTAYLPLCVTLAEEGVDCFLVKMPFNLAVFGKNKAERIMEKYSYDNWYLAGHSLGGAMAADYVAENTEDFAGLIMLAAYPTKPLESEELEVLSIYGSKDEVVNKEKMNAAAEFIPEQYTEIELDGANHAGFGNYGSQEGDGEATLEREKQQEMTVYYIIRMIQ